MDDRTIALLAEIRDLQRQQLENSSKALERQAEAIQRQKELLGRTRRGQKFLVGLVLVLILLYLLPFIGWATGWMVPRPWL